MAAEKNIGTVRRATEREQGRRWLRNGSLALGLLLCSGHGHAVNLLDPANGGSLTHIDKQLNGGRWAAANLIDGRNNTRWLSNRGDNDLVFRFGPTFPEVCFDRLTLRNYGNARSIRQFMLLRSLDQALAADTGITGWRPVVADPNPTGPINHLHWGQGGRLTSVDRQLNGTTWAGEHLNNGSRRDRWLSRRSNNLLTYAFDTDWDGSAGDVINIGEIRLYNYGNNRSVRQFQIEVTEDGGNWRKLEVPGTAAGSPDFNFALAAEGGSLDVINGQLNGTTWAAANLHDGDTRSRWLNRGSVNFLEFVFDPDGDGATGASGDADDLFVLEKFFLRNYGNNRSIRLFQVEVKTQVAPVWRKLPVPGTAAGSPDFNFALAAEGGSLDVINGQLNGTTWAAANLHDGDTRSRWLNRGSVNLLEFVFDPDGDGGTGASGDADDLFSLEKFFLRNYGNNRSIRLFQVEVKTQADPAWRKLEVPGSGAGQPGFNFALNHQGGTLAGIDSQLNGATWAAANLHDGDTRTRWLSRRGQRLNSLEFVFDTNGDGATGDAINIDQLMLRNYGSNRSIETFAIDIQLAGGAWQPLNAPGGGTVFNAGRSSTPQTFAVTPQTDVTGLRLRTLTNYGDAYTGAREFEILGNSVGPSHTFTAQRGSGGETFTLDAADRPVGVTHVRLRTISNYGNAYTGAREFELLGPSMGPSHTFTAARGSGGETFVIDPSTRPVGVTHVRLRTISNYGNTYTGAREFEILGPSVGPSHTFVAGRSVGPTSIVLDTDDQATNVVGARFRTLSNYGDSYTGARQLELLGDPVGPAYVFEPARSASQQTMEFDPVAARLLRFHTFDNFGNRYIGARELTLESSGCGPVADWRMDKPAWTGAPGEVLDISGYGLDGTALNGLTTDFSSPAVAGTPGTCAYGVFDGADDYVEVPDVATLDLNSQVSITAWVRHRTGSFKDWETIVAKGDTAYRLHLNGGCGNGPRNAFTFGLNGGCGANDIAAVVPQAGRWYHVAAVYDGTDAVLYVDGTEQNRSRPGGAINTNNYPLMVGENAQRRGRNWDGDIDELRIYDRPLTPAEVAEVMSSTRACSASTAAVGAFGFNCVGSGQDPLVGRLYTRMTGQGFSLDVVALRDSDGDGTADALETDYAGDADRTVQAELIDTTTAAACGAYPVLNPVVSQSLTFNASDGGRKIWAGISVGKAYRSIGCRVTDNTDTGNPVVGCSTDLFSVRPAAFTVSSTLNNSGAAGNPTAKAGEAFSITATASPGYDGTPQVDSAQLQPHSGAVATGSLTGRFNAANPVTGIAGGANFAYNEVGNFRLAPNGVYDSSFTAVDQPVDCNPGFSNTPVGDKIGCGTGNTVTTAWIGRFTPDHFAVQVNSSGGLTNTCTGFSYAGQSIGFLAGLGPDVEITARNSANAITQNYTGAYRKLVVGNVIVSGGNQDASQFGADGSTPVSINWTRANALNDIAPGVMRYVLESDTFIYDRNANAMVAPFPADIDLGVTQVTDSDGVAGNGLPVTVEPTATEIRFGRFALENAHGSELLPLDLPHLVQHFNGASFVANTADNCTPYNAANLLFSNLSGLSADPAASGNGVLVGGVPLTPVSLDASGAAGSVDVTLPVSSWLQFDWDNNGLFDNDPTAHATFGIYKGNGRQIYVREMY